MACDLAKGVRAAGAPALRVMALTDNIPLMTAWANDTSYERIFAEQLATLAREGDAIILISASGNSPNVLAVLEVARRLGVTVIALTGQTGGQLGRLADLVARVPADLIEQVEDAHMIIAHSLCVSLRKRLQRDFGRHASETRPAHPVRQPALQPASLDAPYSGPLIALPVVEDELAPELAEAGA
jgi:D-sedoheptulose 7-phosphate isomerase